MARNKLSVQIAQMARAAELQTRQQQVETWRYAGHLSYMNTENPGFIDVKLGDETFHEPRSTFPTTKFVARAALAIAAGQSNRVQAHDASSHGADAMSYTSPPKAVWRDLAWFDEYGTFDMKKITAKVTPRSNKKGLRP